jgi:hypothetical protein
MYNTIYLMIKQFTKLLSNPVMKSEWISNIRMTRERVNTPNTKKIDKDMEQAFKYRDPYAQPKRNAHERTPP